jgi:hypothetical protein
MKAILARKRALKKWALENKVAIPKGFRLTPFMGKWARQLLKSFQTWAKLSPTGTWNTPTLKALDPWFPHPFVPQKGIDYAWGFHVSLPELLKKKGITAVGRYIALGSSGKHLSRLELAALHKQGIKVFVCAEGSASRMLQGYWAGVSDAKEARDVLRGLGVKNPFCYFTCDFDAGSGQLPAVMRYLDGAASVLGLNGTGVYGGYYVVAEALKKSIAHPRGRASKAWQACAWSGGKVHPKAAILQHTGTPYGNLGLGYDPDDIRVADYGQF